MKDLEALAIFPYSGHAMLMGKTRYAWQDDESILALFAAKDARAAYLDFVRAGLAQGRRPDLSGGGLMRTHGGWTEISKSPQRLKGDVRVLGDSQFVLDVLSQAQQELEHRYRLKIMGVDFPFVERRVLELCGLSPDDLYSRGRQKQRAAARGLLCFWAVRELGMSQTELSGRLRMTQPGIASAVARGQRLAKEKGYLLFAAAPR